MIMAFYLSAGEDGMLYFDLFTIEEQPSLQTNEAVNRSRQIKTNEEKPNPARPSFWIIPDNCSQ